MTKKQKSFMETVVEVMSAEGSKRLSERFVNSYLPDTLDEHTKEQLRLEAQREIGNVFSTIKQRFEKVAAHGANMLRPRKEVLAACKTLQVTPPRLGHPVDLDLARKNRKTQMKVFHPDVSPNTRDEYEAAVKAYDVLADYNAALKGAPANGT